MWPTVRYHDGTDEVSKSMTISQMTYALGDLWHARGMSMAKGLWNDLLSPRNPVSESERQAAAWIASLPPDKREWLRQRLYQWVDAGVFAACSTLDLCFNPGPPFEHGGFEVWYVEGESRTLLHPVEIDLHDVYGRIEAPPIEGMQP